MNNLQRADVARRYRERATVQPSREQMLEDIDALTADLIILEHENKALKAELQQAYDKGYDDGVASADPDEAYEAGYTEGFEDGTDAAEELQQEPK